MLEEVERMPMDTGATRTPGEGGGVGEMGAASWIHGARTVVEAVYVCICVRAPGGDPTMSRRVAKRWKYSLYCCSVSSTIPSLPVCGGGVEP